MIKTTWININTEGCDDVIDITDKVKSKIKEAKVADGIATIFVHGSTASVTTIEYESGLVKDIKDLGERLAPSDQDYAHNASWGDGNGYSHIRASTIGPSLTVPIEKGGLTLGTWQQIVVIDHDTRPRSRKIVIQVMGE